MISKKMAEALNQQMGREFYSAYLYLAMSSYAAYIGMKGAANWFMVQYQEEMTHFMKIHDYVLNQGEQVLLGAVDATPASFKSLTDMFEQTLKHEKFITQSINEVMNTAVNEKDHATQIFMQWFVTEQIEEEANDNDILARLKLIGKEGNGLFMLDKDLGTRVFTPPAAAAAAG